LLETEEIVERQPEGDCGLEIENGCS
jgi:hypothetical protein